MPSVLKGNNSVISGNTTFSVRPMFGTNTPWDSGNLTPSNYAPLSGATFSGPVTIPTLTTTSRPTFNGYTPWDSGNFTPSNYAPLSNPSFTGQVGATTIKVAASNTSVGGGGVVFDTSNQNIRIYENGGAFRGAYIDLTSCNSQSLIWTNGNFNPANYMPLGSATSVTASGAVEIHPWSIGYTAANGSSQSVYQYLTQANNTSYNIGMYDSQFGSIWNTVQNSTDFYLRGSKAWTAANFNPANYAPLSGANFTGPTTITSTDSSFTGTPLSLKRPNGQLMMQDGANTSNQWMLNSYQDGKLYLQAYSNGVFGSNILSLERGGNVNVTGTLLAASAYISGPSATIHVVDRTNGANDYQIYNTNGILRFYNSADRFTLDANGTGTFPGNVQIGATVASGLFGDTGSLALRAYGNNAINFQNQSGAQTYGYWANNNLVVNTNLSLAAGKTFYTNGSNISTNTSSIGGMNLTAGDGTHTGYIEFWSPSNTSARLGYIGYGTNGGTINISGDNASWQFIGNKPTFANGLNSAGDIYVWRTGAATTGVVYLNQAGNAYLYFDGTQYNMPGYQAYVAGGQVWHNNNQTFSAASPGYVRLPNGLLIQWGVEQSGAGDLGITFPVTFAAVYSITATVSADDGNGGSTYVATAAIVSTSYFNMRKRIITPGNVAGTGAASCWIAIGR